MKLSFALSLLLPAASAEFLRSSSTTTNKDCYDSTDAIFEAISDDSKLDQQKRFVVCPNTVIDVGLLVPGVGIDQGQHPIIPRSNTEFLCGEDGSSSNNCILRGGDFGVIAVPVFFRQDMEVNNVQIKGFTFQNQVQYGAFMATKGDIAFEDCVFEDAANLGTIVANFDATRDLGDSAKENDSNDVLDLVMKGCDFINLSQVEPKLGVERGIITVNGPDHKVTLENNFFAYNHFGETERLSDGYMVKIHQAETHMHNNQFLNNEYASAGPIVLEGTVNEDMAKNNVIDEVEEEEVSEEEVEDIRVAIAAAVREEEASEDNVDLQFVEEVSEDMAEETTNAEVQI